MAVLPSALPHLATVRPNQYVGFTVLFVHFWMLFNAIAVYELIRKTSRGTRLAQTTPRCSPTAPKKLF